ncbi:ABC-three component system protein [Rothia sp. HMSC065D02]|uniref:ABC-three component system protein n=1 Tax=Rothia sp. HMSC065D02 TaxID=1739518 RepID=UPI000A9C968B|nr:ABC-three component system protein [Rothia sp. HMSC065D02]
MEMKKVTLIDMQRPAEHVIMPSLEGPPVTPKQRVYWYDPAEWEEFIREWVTSLKYQQIKRMGGSNDHGVDVAGFKTDRGFEGPWDCYQGKHYNRPLEPSDAFSEILKVFRAVHDGYYTMPQRYAFLAPKGCGPSLNRLLSQPSKLRTKFIDWVNQKKGSASDLEDIRDDILKLVRDTEFNCFQSVELEDMIKDHSKTSYHVARFGGPLPTRKPYDGNVPEDVETREARYIDQLIEVYRENNPDENLSPDTISSHNEHGSHFRRQRESFYSAEALRLYARDSVPEGTFEDLQNDIYSGVIEIAEEVHQTGRERLTAVLTAAGKLDLQAHKLISVSRIDDRKGICHQLANEDRLIWVKR